LVEVLASARLCSPLKLRFSSTTPDENPARRIAKRERLPSNVSIRSDPAMKIPSLLGTPAPDHSR
jgi:hypothetical protein